MPNHSTSPCSPSSRSISATIVVWIPFPGLVNLLRNINLGSIFSFKHTRRRLAKYPASRSHPEMRCTTPQCPSEAAGVTVTFPECFLTTSTCFLSLHHRSNPNGVTTRHCLQCCPILAALFTVTPERATITRRVASSRITAAR